MHRHCFKIPWHSAAPLSASTKISIFRTSILRHAKSSVSFRVGRVFRTRFSERKRAMSTIQQEEKLLKVLSRHVLYANLSLFLTHQRVLKAPVPYFVCNELIAGFGFISAACVSLSPLHPNFYTCESISHTYRSSRPCRTACLVIYFSWRAARWYVRRPFGVILSTFSSLLRLLLLSRRLIRINTHALLSLCARFSC